VDRRFSFGVELQARKTFTDYLDDTSTQYADNDAIQQNSGTKAATLADPNLTNTPRKTGIKRGNPENPDNYFFLTLTMRIFLSPGKG
jgi:hypothetical protein